MSITYEYEHYMLSFTYIVFMYICVANRGQTDVDQAWLGMETNIENRATIPSKCRVRRIQIQKKNYKLPYPQSFLKEFQAISPPFAKFIAAIICRSPSPLQHYRFTIPFQNLSSLLELLGNRNIHLMKHTVEYDSVADMALRARLMPNKSFQQRRRRQVEATQL